MAHKINHPRKSQRYPENTQVFLLCCKYDFSLLRMFVRLRQYQNKVLRSTSCVGLTRWNILKIAGMESEHHDGRNMESSFSLMRGNIVFLFVFILDCNFQFCKNAASLCSTICEQKTARGLLIFAVLNHIM